MFFVLMFLVLLFVCLIYCIKYFMLLCAKRSADRAFQDAYNKLEQQYNAIESLFSQFPILSLEDKVLIQNTKKLISHAREFSVEKDGNEIIVAYANTILENVQKFSDSVLEKEPENSHINKYQYALAVFNKAKEDYNKSAKKLKHYVDVFPTSFYARLKKIKTMDYFND